MLGNLLDNAGKWAHRQVSVTLAPATAPGMLLITVDDDGPGIADAAQRQQIFQRGERLDENRPGTGLGLNTVQVLAQNLWRRCAGRALSAGRLAAAIAAAIEHTHCRHRCMTTALAPRPAIAIR